MGNRTGRVYPHLLSGQVEEDHIEEVADLKEEMKESINHESIYLDEGKNVSNPASLRLENYGRDVFYGSIASPYLQKHGLSAGDLDNNWIINNNIIEKVAAAILDWACDRGAKYYGHWCHPLGGNGLRYGGSAIVYRSLVTHNSRNTPTLGFSGNNLIRDEAEVSFFPTGGLRTLHSGGGFVTLDVNSHIFIRDDTVYLPACISSYEGYALDEKMPLLRASTSISREGKRLLRLLGCEVDALICEVGIEQEFYLVGQEIFAKRLDFQLAGRAVIGKPPPRGQEARDQYCSPIPLSSLVMKCFKDIHEECTKLGIPINKLHKEVAPHQYEISIHHCDVRLIADMSLLLMQIIEECAEKHNLVALLREKPFKFTNGSGKMNFWSIMTDTGLNLLNVTECGKLKSTTEIFPLMIAALVKSLGEYGDLYRMAIAVPGNELRLGSEGGAPPTLISIHLGEDLTKYLDNYRKGIKSTYMPFANKWDVPVELLLRFHLPHRDRNRTSSLTYGDNKLEFRGVGASQSVGPVNTIIAATVAKSFKDFACAIENGQDIDSVVVKALNDNWHVICNESCYDPTIRDKVKSAGGWDIESNVEAICTLTHPKNVALFEEMKILTPEECEARKIVKLQHYSGTVEIEAQTMIDIVHQHVIPAVKTAKIGPLIALETGVDVVNEKLIELRNMNENDAVNRAQFARRLRIEVMEDLRKKCDEAEAVVPAHLWTLATYKQLLFD